MPIATVHTGLPTSVAEAVYLDLSQIEQVIAPCMTR